MLLGVSRARPPAAASAEEASGPTRALLAVFLLVVAAPSLLTPFTAAPFVDAKLLVVGVAALLLVPAAARAPRGLRALVVLWLAASMAATLSGVDPWASMLGRENEGTGLALLIALGTVLLAGSMLSGRAAAATPRLIVATAVAAGVVGIAGRWTSLRMPGGVLDLSGGTLGHPAFLAAFVALGIVLLAAAGTPHPRTQVATAALLASALSLTANRGGVIAALLGLTMVALRDRERRAAAARVAATLVAVTIVWTGLQVVVGGDHLSPAKRFTQVAEGSAADRLPVWAVAVEAGMSRPAFGWGPGNAWGALLSTMDEGQVREVGRGWADPHNMFLHSLVTSGLIGLGTLAVLLVAVARRARAAPPSRTWALAGASALLVPHLLQPMNVALTPILFLLLGLAGPPGAFAARIPARRRGVALAAVVLSGVVLLAGLRAAASTLEGHALTYGSHAIARAALTLEPRRAAVMGWLARHRAVDHEADTAAWARRAVAARPWDGGIRLAASDALLVLGDLDGSRRWLEDHLARFPNDPAGMTKRALLELRAGDTDAARRWAARAFSLDPTSPAPGIVEDNAGR